MKKITFLIIAIITLCFSFSAKAQCNYTLEMNDSWGDGWNSGTMDVLVDGVVVIDEATIDDGFQALLTFSVSDGQDVTTLHSTNGSYPGEMSYRILDALGAEVGTGDPTADITAGTITVACPTCAVPSATYSTVSNCPVDTGFTIEVVVSDIGDASGVTISDDQGTTVSAGLTAGTYTYGAYANATDVVITITNDDDGTCVTSSNSLTFATSCPPANDLCGDAIPVGCDETVVGDTSDPSVTNSVGNSSADLWYSYSGAAGDITASLCGSSYDTNMRVFDSCGGAEITNNDDSCGTQSVVTFVADGMSTYYIAVEGYLSSEGAFTLTITCAAPTPPPANDLCGDAIALTLTVPESGTTVGAVENVADEKPSCDLFGNIADVWYTVTLPTGTNTLNVITTVSGDSSEANLAIYSNDCTILAANQLACDDLGGFSGETLTIGGTAGTTYLIRVWSDGVAPAPPSGGRTEGTFTIVADATLSVDSLQNENAFTYFPNPVKNQLTLNAQKDIQNVSVYNMLGQEVLRTAPNSVNSTISMSELSQGAYFVQVTIGNVTETLRILKQ
jgi:hypothetical protein